MTIEAIEVKQTEEAIMGHEIIYDSEVIGGVMCFFADDEYVLMIVLFEKVGIESKDSGSSFTNKYGTATTKCAHSGCDKYIASSGDTNACVEHSQRCMNCNCYIDEDTVYCMSCISDALSN